MFVKLTMKILYNYSEMKMLPCFDTQTSISHPMVVIRASRSFCVWCSNNCTWSINIKISHITEVKKRLISFSVLDKSHFFFCRKVHVRMLALQRRCCPKGDRFIRLNSCWNEHKIQRSFTNVWPNLCSLHRFQNIQKPNGWVK